MFLRYRRISARPVRLRITGEISLEASRAEVWALLADPSFEARVNPRLSATGTLTGMPAGRGAIQYFVADTDDGPRGTMAVMDVVRDQSEIRWEYISSDFASGWGFLLGDGSAPDECRLEHTHWITIPRGFPVRLVKANRRSLAVAARRFEQVVAAAFEPMPAARRIVEADC